MEGRPEEVKGNYGICVASRRRLTEGRRMKGWEEAAPRAALVCEREVVPVCVGTFPSLLHPLLFLFSRSNLLFERNLSVSFNRPLFCQTFLSSFPPSRLLNYASF